MPLKPRKKKLTLQDVARIEKQHRDKSEIQVNTRVTAGQALRILDAKKRSINIQVGDEIGYDCGNKGEAYVDAGDLDPKIGVIVVDPISKRPASIIGDQNLVYNIDGTPTARTAKYLRDQSST